MMKDYNKDIKGNKSLQSRSYTRTLNFSPSSAQLVEVNEVNVFIKHR